MDGYRSILSTIASTLCSWPLSLSCLSAICCVQIMPFIIERNMGLLIGLSFAWKFYGSFTTVFTLSSSVLIVWLDLLKRQSNAISWNPLMKWNNNGSNINYLPSWNDWQDHHVVDFEVEITFQGLIELLIVRKIILNQRLRFLQHIFEYLTITAEDSNLFLNIIKASSSNLKQEAFLNTLGLLNMSQ